MQGAFFDRNWSMCRVSRVMGDAIEARLRKELLEGTPLPPCWSAVSKPGGKVEYVNDITGERQSIHPAEGYIQSRLNTAEAGSSGASQGGLGPMSSVSSLEDHSRVGREELREEAQHWERGPTAAGEDDSKLRMDEPWRQGRRMALVAT